MFLRASVFGANNQMDQTRATLMAITKDGGETSRIIGMINQEAARTPYVFGEMASTYTALLPLSKQYNTSLQELVETAELLAASKPEQGLAGAAFSLREAMSGDYMSLISRFDLPRQYINQLKAEGVPALEIVRQAMGQMGYDSDTVSYTHLRAHETVLDLVCRLLLEKQTTNSKLTVSIHHSTL